MSVHLSLIFLGVLIAVAGGVIVFGLARHYRRDLGLQAQERERSQETGFIINAFHEVTKQLKEKEKELERLKSLAEQRAANVESYNENILQCVTSGVMTFDRDCMLSTMNRAAGEILGIQHDPNAGMSCLTLFGEGEITKAVHETIEKKKPSARMESVLDRSSGKIWLGYNTAVLTDRQGDALGVILSFSDLTEVKLLQEQMELRRRLTALGEMSAGIAHELRNPMAVIAGYVNLLSKKTGPESQTIIGDITNEINGMNRIIGDLLTFARPASLNRIPVNLRELIDACMTSILQATGAEGRIVTSVKVNDIELPLDEVLMRQAFSNLFQNAIEAMPEGGTITVEARDGKNIAVSVTDTGTGIPRDALKRLFLPFFTTKDKGVGLGLALVHKIVLSHGGTIEVKSKEDSGTTFTVMLPKGN
jgi:two-component system sensor histidine kinase AtoS